MLASLKRQIEKTLVRSSALRLARWLRPVDTIILAYHNIVPQHEPVFGERNLHLPLQDLCRQLDLLQETHQVVGLDRLAERPDSDGRPRAVITFDDAYCGAVTIGVSEVVKRGLSATVFVSPALLGGCVFWWDALADPTNGRISPDLRRQAHGRWAGGQDVVARGADDRRSGRDIPLHATCASLGDLQQAALQPGISLASHTWSHPDLTRLKHDEVAYQLSSSLEWLRKRFEQVIPWLSYPYGRSSPGVRRAVPAAGYQGAVLVEGGGVRDRCKVDPYAVPRVNVPAGVSLEGFMLRVAGLRPS